MIVDNISVDMVEQLLCWQRCTPSDPLLTKVNFFQVVNCVFNELLSIVSVLIVVVVCSLQRRFVCI